MAKIERLERSHAIGAVMWIVDGPRGRRIGVARNRLTNAYPARQAQWSAGVNNTGQNPVPPPSQTQLGTGSNPSGVLPTATALWTATAGTLKACNSISVYQTYYSQFQTQYLTSDPSGTFTEAGLLDSASVLLAHVALSVSKASDETLTLIWKILHQGN